MKLSRRSVVLAKTEATYGVDPTPNAADGILVNEGVNIQPSANVIERNNLRDSLSPQGYVVGAKELAFDVTCELKGGGLSGSTPNAPEYEPFLLACGMKKTVAVEIAAAAIGDLVPGETVTGGTSSATGTLLAVLPSGLLVEAVAGTFENGETVTGGTSAETATATADPIEVFDYTPVSDPDEMGSCTIYFFKDGILHISTGCRGSWEINCPVGEIPTIKFTMRGLWVDPSDQATPTPECVDIAPPVVVGMGLSVGTFAPVVAALTLAVNNELVQRKDVNAPEGVIGIAIKARKPSGSLDPEVDTLANFNPWEKWKDAVSSALAATLGKEAGNRIEIYIPKATFGDMQYGDRDGIATYEINYGCVADVSDDELRLIYK